MKRKAFIGIILFVFLASASLAEMDEWRLRIGVKAGDRYRDSHNFIGVARDASLFYDGKDLPEPPTSPSGLMLYFPHEDWAYQPGRYASDIRPPIAGVEIYEFAVEAGEYTTLTLFWPDIGTVPESYRFMLVDEEREVFVDMREAQEYAFDCRPGMKNRFRIVVEKR